MVETHYGISEGFNVRLESRLKNAALVSAREKLDLTQKRAAEEIGTYPTNLSRIELMKYYPPKELQKRICDFYRNKGVFMLEEDVFPEELENISPKKQIIEREIPRQQLISLDSVDQKLLPYVEGVEKIASDNERYDTIEEVLDTLTERERKVIEWRFGLVPFIDTESSKYSGIPSFRAIAEVLNFTPVWIQQLEHKALRKLKRPSRSRILKTVL